LANESVFYRQPACLGSGKNERFQFIMEHLQLGRLFLGTANARFTVWKNSVRFPGGSQKDLSVTLAPWIFHCVTTFQMKSKPGGNCFHGNSIAEAKDPSIPWPTLTDRKNGEESPNNHP
jgi:hypothetical protein